jgi:hypothetical protein
VARLFTAALVAIATVSAVAPAASQALGGFSVTFAPPPHVMAPPPYAMGPPPYAMRPPPHPYYAMAAMPPYGYWWRITRCVTDEGYGRRGFC